MGSDRHPANTGRRQDPAVVVQQLSEALASKDKYKAERNALREEIQQYKATIRSLKTEARAEREGKVAAQNVQTQLLHENEILLEENKQLKVRNQFLENDLEGLQAKFEHVTYRLEAIKHPDTANPMVAIPDRTKKHSPSGSKAPSSSTSIAQSTSSSGLEREREKDRERARREKKDREEITENLAERLGRPRAPPPAAMENFSGSSRRKESKSRSRPDFETSRRGSVDFSSVPRSHASRQGHWRTSYTDCSAAYADYNPQLDVNEMDDGNYHAPVHR